jgi:large-conductance mechanosensitive channel
MQHPIRLEPLSRLLMQRIEEIMDWIPIVFIAFKLLVIGTALFFSIKSHHDKEKEEQEEERERQARASGTGSAIQLGQVQQHVGASQCARQSGPG